jgi:transcriptional regulator with XRE-family HTH domain
MDDVAIIELGRRIAVLRKAKGLTLQQLAARSGVSRAMLSKVERAEKSPTLAIMSRIARGLDVSLSTLIGARPNSSKVVVVRKAERVIFKDSVSGFDRELLSPHHVDNGVELLLHEIPAGKSSGVLPVYTTPTEKYLIVHQGSLTVVIGENRHTLREGDCLYFEVTSPYSFMNEGRVPCSYYLFVIRRR